MNGWLTAVLTAAALASLPPSTTQAQGAPPVPAEGGSVGEPPPVTLLYQNFPNPFTPSEESRTCIWFDLARDTRVRLEVTDLRTRRVRQILPATGFSGVLPAGRYGRGSGKECDPVISWDGRDENGRVVPSGVYLLRLTADGQSVSRKIIVQVL